ncbi:transcriptional regulator [Streptococcus equi subsp. zooepidemicus Sz57]|nr:transcriptional regulator [Streptococcus equi subsp. zooepidemicus Sz57]
MIPSMDTMSLVKSLQTCLKVSITVFDKNHQATESFWNDDTFEFYYRFQAVLRQMDKEQATNLFFQGSYNELFLIYRYQDHYILIGPWRCNVLDKTFFKVAVADKDLTKEEEEILYQALKHLPVYPLSAIRDLLIVVHYFFSGKIEDLLSPPLRHYIRDFSDNIEVQKANMFVKKQESKVCLYNYEKNLSSIVQEGDVHKLKEIIFSLRNTFIPVVSGDTLRSEKNYSIIAFDRLAQIAIQSGMDIADAYHSREEFMRDSELATSMPDVLKIRDASLVFYTQKVSELRDNRWKHVSPTVNAIIQYISVNLHKSVTTAELAQHFNMSESKLRQIFKRDTDLTIYQYTSNMKIEEAKTLLRSAYAINHISDVLGFTDPSHFSKFFKKHTGESPKAYQNRKH